MANVNIANEALLLLGEREITDLGDDSVAATALNILFIPTRQRMLRSAVWTFATKRTQLYVDLDLPPAVWAVGTTYAAGATVNNGSTSIFVSRVNGNIGNNPGSSPTQWRTISPYQAADINLGTTYATGEIVRDGGNVFAAILAGSGHSTSNTTYWVDTGLDEDTPLFGFQHKYTIPTDFLRMAPATFADWSCFQEIQREGATKFLSQVDQPMNIRYVYDFNTDNETQVDPLFNSALAAKLASLSCERITQSNNKKADADAKYREFMLEAKRTNAIERGPFVPRLDDWIAVRQEWGSNTSAAAGRLWPWF